MSGGGKSSTTTSGVSIPPEVLEQYRNVMNIANLTSQQPFQPYTGEFVAPLTQTQQAGIANINQAAGMAQPYFGAAAQSLLGGASQAQPYYDTATNQVLGGLNVAQPLQQSAAGNISGAVSGAAPYLSGSQQALAAGMGQSQPMLQGSLNTLSGGAASASPLQQQAASNITNAYAAAAPLSDQSISTIAGAAQAAQPYMSGAQQNIAAGLGSAINTQQSALQNVTGAMQSAQPLTQSSVNALLQANQQAQPLAASSLQALNAGLGAASPLQQMSASDISGAQAGASPYQSLATQFGLSGAQGVSPDKLDVGQYMSPYIQSVVEPTRQLLQQQQQMEQQRILGDQARSGAFGGDRGRIAQAVLAQQQNLATAKSIGDLYQQGYGQAIGTAQQQQGLQLTAAQANRAAQQQAAQQMLGIGQQGFGQGLAAAQQRAALAQQMYGQGLSSSQQQAALSQMLFGQGATTAQQQAALAQQLYAQGMGASAQQAAIAQQQAQQGLGAAAAQTALAQQAFGQQATTAQQQAAMAQQLYAQNMGASAQQAALAQQLFGQGATTAQQQQAVAQQLFGQGATAAQQQAALGQQYYQQNMGAAQQQAALAQQLYGQYLGSGQALAGLGQGLYGMGAGVSQGLAGLGTGAQAAALQGGQAQLGAGQVQQQTNQAQNQAYYNQFLQQQGYPFQTAQFLGNLAMGTGALSGSTTTTTQPTSFFSDKRLKDDIERIGKTYDGQDIVRYRYKGEPATRIGLVAQDVEKKHPEAVGLAGGYKTVDYDKATDAAAARAPKAYGGGLNPWGDPSAYGGSVFREDAGRGYAVGGAPGGDDILAQINALVNSHQGIFPYGKAGMYGSGMGKAGPYGSTLMQTPNRGLMRAENVGTRPVSAMEGIESTMKRAENIRNLYRGAKGGVEFVKTESQLSPTYTTAGQGPTQSGEALGTPTTIRDYLDSFFGGANQGTVVPEPGMYRGGLVRGNYAMGGMPYSQAENEYVPEDISAPVKPQGLQPAKPAAPGRTTGDDIMTMIKLASMASGMGRSSGGVVPRQGYQQGGDPVEDEVIHGYSRRAIEDMFNQGIIPIESRGQQFDAQGQPLRSPRGATGVAQVMPSTGPEAARLAGLDWDQRRFETDPEYNRDLGLAYFTHQLRQQGDPLRAAAAYNAGPRGLQDALAGGEDYFGRLPAETQAYLRRFASNNPGGLIPPALMDQVFGQQQTATSQPGLAPRSAVQNEQQKPAEKDWFGRNESWIMPLVTGLGTMASSPSRYLGSAVLQGLMGAGQAAQQNIALEGQRLKTAEETKKIAEEAELNRQRQQLTGASTQQILSGIAAGAEDPNRRTVRIFRNGRYTLIPREEFYNNPAEYQLYLAPYSAEERARFQTPPSREPAPSAAPGAPSREPGAPTGGGQPAPDGSRPDAEPVPPPTVPTTRSTDPVALVTSLPEETRNLADQEIRVARGQSTTDLRSAAERIPSAQDVFTTARTRASAAAGSLPDRLNLAKEFMALPDEGIGSLGRANVFLTPMLSWANSTLRLFNVQDRDGNLVQLSPRQLAGLEAIDKETIQTALNRQGQSGSRAFAELNAILSATPNTQMTRETVQKILASNFMEEQRAVDLDNFANLWRNYAIRGREGAVGVSPDELRLTGPQVEREFNRLYNAQYNREKAGIEKILDSRVGGRPLIDLIIESRGEPSQQMVEYMNNNFANEGGARLLRYFYGR